MDNDMNTLPKKKEAEDTTLKVLVSKDSKEILEDIVLESLKTLFTDEIQRKIVQEATIVVVDGEPVLEEAIIKSMQAQSALEAKQVEFEELERLQSTI